MNGVSTQSDIAGKLVMTIWIVNAIYAPLGSSLSGAIARSAATPREAVKLSFCKSGKADDRSSHPWENTL